MNYTITKNNQFKSIEINFTGKPCEAIRSALKNIGFRWHSVRRIWYGYADEQTAKDAIENADDADVTSIFKRQAEQRQTEPRRKSEGTERKGNSEGGGT